jgi:hypothetical protein
VGSSSSSAIVRAPSPVGSSPSVQDDEYFEVDGPEFDGDEEGREVRVVITRLNKEERINDLTGVKKQVDWYKVVIGDVSNNICVDPHDGVKVWAKYGEPMECAYKNIDDLMENLLKDHSRHCVPRKGGYDGLTGNERDTPKEIGKELRSSRVQDGSQNGGGYQSNRILKESARSHGSATMRALASLVFDTIYFDTDRAASLHLEGAWIGKVNWYAKAADGGGDDGAADLLIPSLVVMMVLLMQIVVANSTSTETGAPLKGPGRSSLGGGFKASG